MNESNKKLIFLGAGGHFHACYDVARTCGYDVLGVLDDVGGSYTLPYLGKLSDKQRYDAAFFVSIGDSSVRRHHFVSPAPSLVSPSAYVSPSATIGEGTVVMPMAFVGANVSVGKGCIVNTGAVLEHDCVVGDFCHLCPNCTIAGSVIIGSDTLIGASACIVNNIKITDGVTVGAGAVVIRNIDEKGTYVGVPARRL